MVIISATFVWEGLLLFLVVDVSKPPATQVSAGLTVGRLLDLSAQGSQHGAET